MSLLLFMPTLCFLKMYVYITSLTYIHYVQEECWSMGIKGRTWSVIPCEQSVNNADPVARMFNGRLYVNTSWDYEHACGRWRNKPLWKKQGVQSFCMPGYRAYSTADASFQSGWKAHGCTYTLIQLLVCAFLFISNVNILYSQTAILKEEQVAWVYRGDEGYKAAARMWASDVIQGNDGLYDMLFSAPDLTRRMRIGVAVASNPGGPFRPRRNHFPGMVGIDPSVVRLPSGSWFIFTSISGPIYAQRMNSEFTRYRAIGRKNLPRDRRLVQKSQLDVLP